VFDGAQKGKERKRTEEEKEGKEKRKGRGKKKGKKMQTLHSVTSMYVSVLNFTRNLIFHFLVKSAFLKNRKNLIFSL
jgi:hypothetical protein